MTLETSTPRKNLGNAASPEEVAPREAERQMKVVRGAVGLGRFWGPKSWGDKISP